MKEDEATPTVSLQLRGAPTEIPGRTVPFVQINKGCITISIAKTTTSALVDTGASLSVIKRDFLDTLFLPENVKAGQKCHCRVFLADGSTVFIRKKVKLTFQIGHQEFSNEFKVMDKMDRPVILGVDFLSKYRASIKFDEEQMKTKPRTIRAVKNITLPPWAEVTLTGRVVSELSYDKESIGICENLDRGTEANIPFLVKKSLVTPQCNNKHVPITLLNTSHSYRRVKKGQILALYQPVDFDNLIPLRQQTNMSTDNVNSLSANPVLSKLEQEATNSNRQSGYADKSYINYTHPNCILNPQQQQQLEALLRRYSDVFVGTDGKLGLTSEVQHNIQLQPNSEPVSVLPYRQSPKKKALMREIIREQLHQGIIEEAGPGEWSSPAFLVPKASGEHRLVVDYRGLNAQTINQSVNIPRVDDTLDSLGQAKPRFLSCLDLQSGFHQVPIHPGDRDKTAFLTHDGRYHYKVLPMGLKNSPRSFQVLMDLVLAKVRFRIAICYMDDIVIWSQTFEDHMNHLEQVLILLRKANLKLKRKKCTFGVDRLRYLGFMIHEQGISPCEDKVEAIKSFPIPQNVRQVRSFVGMAQFYRKFIKDFATIARPLYNLMKAHVKFSWTNDCQLSFETLKGALCSDDILIYPDFSKRFIVATDASDMSIGATLCQYHDNDTLRPVAYAGRSLNKAEKNYSVTHRELLAIVWACEHFKVYLQDEEFDLYTDHSALSYINKQKHLNQRLARWQLFLQQFNFVPHYIKGKLNVIPDALSRRTYDHDHTDADDKIDAFPDLASISIDAVQRNRVRFQTNLPVHETPVHTPNQFKKSFALKSILKNRHCYSITAPLPGQANVHAITRSNTNTNTAVKPPTSNIQSKYTKGNTRKTNGKQNGNTTFKANTPTHTKTRKRISDIIMDKANKVIELLTADNSFNLSSSSLRREQKHDDFCEEMLNFLKHGRQPDDPVAARNILLAQDQYMEVDGVLFNIGSKSLDGSVKARLVIPRSLQKTLMEFHHDSSFAGHMGIGKTLGFMRERYYWPTLNKDVRTYIRSCHKCLSTKKPRNLAVPPMTLKAPSPYPFSCVCLDTLECTTTERGNRYIQVVVDYNTRYVICWPTSSMTADALAREFLDHVICRMGAPQTLITDNGSAFISNVFKSMCKMYKIEQRFSSVFRPQTQGITERMNQTILSSLRTLVNQKQSDWDLHLQPLTFAINSTEAYALGYSPFFLVHGRNPPSPVEINQAQPFDLPKTVKDHLVDLLQVQEIANDYAQKKLAEIQKQMKERHDVKAKNFEFEPGDIVYVYIPRIQDKGTKLKLAPCYHGPMVIVRMSTPATAYLRRLGDGHYFKKSVHISRLKKAHLRDKGTFMKQVISDPAHLPSATETFISDTALQS